MPPRSRRCGASSSGTGAASGAITLPGIVARCGNAGLIAYARFLTGRFVFDAVSVAFMGCAMGKSRSDIASRMSQFGGGGGGVEFIRRLGCASAPVPLVRGRAGRPGSRSRCRW